MVLVALVRRSVLVVGGLAALFPDPAHAILGIEIGARAGSCSYSGDVFAGSETFEDSDAGAATGFGIRLGIMSLPLVDLFTEFSASSRTSAVTLFDDDGVETGQREYELLDWGVEGSVRFPIWDPPLSPITIFVGGGGGLHWIPADPKPSGNDEVETASRPKPSAHFVGGIRFEPPALPLALFLEGQMGGIFLGEGTLGSNFVSAGLSFGL